MIDDKVCGRAGAANDGARPQVGPRSLSPTENFLAETLVRRPSLMSRNGVAYITVRRWRRAIKTYQIDALQALKAAPSADFVDLIADEILDTISGVMGSPAFRVIVPVPCSRSTTTCLPRLVATTMAARAGAQLIHALTIEPASGRSHPKANLRRPRMQLVRPIDRPTLIIDDVATSGAHLEEATRLLRTPTTPVLAVAWIGGRTSD